MGPRKIGAILTGLAIGFAGVYFFNSWRKGSGAAVNATAVAAQ